VFPAFGYGTLVRIASLRTDICFRTHRIGHSQDHLVYAVHDTHACYYNVFRNILNDEQIIGIYLSVPNILIVNESEKAIPYFETDFFPAQLLERYIVKVNFLYRCGTFNFYQVPLIIVDRIQDISAGYN
jgi:hypothetical protein